MGLRDQARSKGRDLSGFTQAKLERAVRQLDWRTASPAGRGRLPGQYITRGLQEGLWDGRKEGRESKRGAISRTKKILVFKLPTRGRSHGERQGVKLGRTLWGRLLAEALLSPC